MEFLIQKRPISFLCADKQPSSPDGGGIDYLPFILTLYSAGLRQVFVSRGVGAKNALLEHMPLPETLIGLSLCGPSAPAFLGLLSCVKFYPLMNEWARFRFMVCLSCPFLAPFRDRKGPVLVDAW